jgi:hypothetical protein
MDQATAIASEQKKRSNWELFTNDGRFDSKLPPYHRLRQKSAVYSSTRKDSGLPREKPSSGKLPTFFITYECNRLGKMASNEDFEVA